MFGYVKPYKPEMKIREYDAYKAVYCTLCKQLRKHYGLFARFTLNYDYTFLAMMRFAAKQSPVSVQKGRCPFNPLAKCNHICCNEDDTLAFSAAVAMCMLFYKSKDTLQDEGLLKRLPIWLLNPFIAHWHRKAAKRYPQVEECVSSFFTEQITAENSNATGLDVYCHPTATVLAKLFSLDLSNEVQSTLYSIGYNVGKWIYLADALDDWETDKRKKRFNPFIVRLGADATIETVSEFAQRQLYVCIDEACLAYEAMPQKNFHPILQNILSMGLEQIQNEIIMKVKKNA